MGMYEWDYELYLNRCKNFSFRIYKIIILLMS